MPSLRLVKILITCILWAAFGSSQAHTVDQIYVELTTEGKEFAATMFVDAGYCLPEYRGDENVDPPTQEWLEGLSEEEHLRLQAEAESYIRETLTFMQDEVNVSYEMTFTDYETSPYQFFDSLVGSPILRVKLEGEFLAMGGSFQASWQDQYNASLLVNVVGNMITMDPQSAMDLGIQIEPFPESLGVDEEAQEFLDPEVTIEKQSNWFNFVKVGFRHVVPDGLDHILFIVGLFLFSPAWRPLFHQSLTFTVAHSVTLLLSLLGVFTFGGKWIEVLIALSIAYIAFENLWGKENAKRRLVFVFLFGLLHGLGFASVLRVFIPTDKVFWPIVGFNVGVEVAQVLVLGVCFLIFGWFSKHFKWIRISGSLIVGLIGLYWVFERIIG